MSQLKHNHNHNHIIIILYHILFYSEKWNESLSSKIGSSVHGLLADADSIDDDMELVDLQKKTESGVEVSFNGNK